MRHTRELGSRRRRPRQSKYVMRVGGEEEGGHRSIESRPGPGIATGRKDGPNHHHHHTTKQAVSVCGGGRRTRQRRDARPGGARVYLRPREPISRESARVGPRRAA